MKLMTVGYEGCTPELFFRVLIANHVETLVDVREYPISRKKGFSKTALREAAQAHGIGYTHYKALGCPRAIRHDYRSDKDWQRYTHRYLAYLDTQQEAIAELAAHVQTECCCLLCMEADARFCHRSLVAKRIVKVLRNVTNITVVHLSRQDQEKAAEQEIAAGR